MSNSVQISLQRTQHHFQQTRGLTLNDVDGKGSGGLFHSVDPGCADIVSIEAGVEAVDENTMVPINCEVHPWWHSAAIVHAKAKVCGCWVSQ